MLRSVQDTLAPGVDEVFIGEGSSVRRCCDGIVEGKGKVTKERSGAIWDGGVGDHKED